MGRKGDEMISRRGFLTRLVGGTGMIVAAGLGRSPKKAPEDIDQEMVKRKIGEAKQALSDGICVKGRSYDVTIEDDVGYGYGYYGCDPNRRYRKIKAAENLGRGQLVCWDRESMDPWQVKLLDKDLDGFAGVVHARVKKGECGWIQIEGTRRVKVMAGAKEDNDLGWVLKGLAK